MKAFLKISHWDFTTKYIHYKDPNGSFGKKIKGWEFYLLKLVLKHLNMTFFMSLNQKDLKWRKVM
jgi:hypothetical protein